MHNFFQNYQITKVYVEVQNRVSIGKHFDISSCYMNKQLKIYQIKFDNISQNNLEEIRARFNVFTGGLVIKYMYIYTLTSLIKNIFYNKNLTAVKYKNYNNSIKIEFKKWMCSSFNFNQSKILHKYFNQDGLVKKIFEGQYARH